MVMYLKVTSVYILYTGKIELLVDLCQSHEVLLGTRDWPPCGEQCCLDINKKGLWCDEAYPTL